VDIKHFGELYYLYLPKEVDLAVNLIHTFIKNIGKNKANTLSLNVLATFLTIKNL
jgi:hypothetical protein